MKCLNIIIYYNNYDEVLSYIGEVANIAPDLVDIILVVNSDNDDRVKDLEKELHHRSIENVLIKNPGENIGYLNAMLKTIKGLSLQTYKYIILSNTDIEYRDKDFFQKLLSTKYPTDVACIAPSVYSSANNCYSNPHYKERIEKGKYQRLIKIFSKPLLAMYYLKLSGLKARDQRREKEDSCYVYSPHGCYMIFSKEFIKKISGYEYGAKMYSEEACIGELVRKYNMKCYYDSAIEVVHRESTVTGKIKQNERFSAWRNSIEYILKEFY